MQDKVINILQKEHPIVCCGKINGEKDITPEFCANILSSTKNSKVTSILLDGIDKTIGENKGKYKNFRDILICVLNRNVNQHINDKVASIVIKHLNVDDADVYDRKLTMYISQQNLSKEVKVEMTNFAKKVLKKVPVRVDEIADNISEKIIREQIGVNDVVDECVKEVTQMPKSNIFSIFINRIKNK